MSVQSSIERHTSGAKFVRADLHIHSYGAPPLGSYDVHDATMTPQGIVDSAIALNLKVIAITDHNAIGNVRPAVDYAKGKDILVVPGVELSTPQGHLLIYCPTPDALERFMGKITVSDDRKACHNTMTQCLEFAATVSGFGICAHIDRDGGVEAAHPKFDAFKQAVFNSENLLGLEITSVTNQDWFTHIDPNPDRKNCATIRRTQLKHEPEIVLAKVMGSDSHAMAVLGRNARGDLRLTRFKMESLTFDALRTALRDCAARVRLEDLLPAAVPHFVGMTLEGGFLRDQVVHFSRNLTCIIGGRGAGKSTLLESVRVASGNQSDNSIIDCDVWPDCITLVYEDEAGQRHTFTRPKLGEPTNSNPQGPNSVALESYGQGETAETIQHCDKDPEILLRFLDGFIDLTDLRATDDGLRSALLENQADLERLAFDLKRIPEVEKAKQHADAQIETLKKQKIADIVLLEQKLATERAFRSKLHHNLTSLLTAINDGLSSAELVDLLDGMDGANLAVGKDEYQAVRTLVTTLVTDVDTVSTQIKARVKDATDKINAQLTAWIVKEQNTREKIEDTRRELEKQKIPLDMAYIRKVTKDATDFALLLEKLKRSIPENKEAWKQRRRLIAERHAVTAKISALRQAFASAMNRNLLSCVVDYAVHIGFHDGRLSPKLEEIVKNAMNWRTSQVPRAALIASYLSPLTLADAIDRKNPVPIQKILHEGEPAFTAAEAAQIIDALADWKIRCEIERCPLDDRPEIRVTKTVVHPDGTKTYPAKDFSQLSLGQQQSILLTILLFSKSKTPLLIDQPEDNLDSEFIYTTLVRSLRNIKEHRQVIIVTHNANIAVLGDAELIIPLRGASEYSVIRDRGSIDTKETKEIVCTILEGSPKAFKRRYELYGFA